MILNVSRCIPDILLHFQRRTSRRANTAAAVIVHTQMQLFYCLIIWSWSSPRFEDICDLKLAINQSHPAWQIPTQNAELKSFNVTH